MAGINLIDIAIAKVRALRAGLDELDTTLVAVREVVEGRATATVTPAPKPASKPAPTPAPTPAPAPTPKPTPAPTAAGEELTRRRLASGRRSRFRTKWTDEETLQLVDLIPKLPMSGPGSLMKRTAMIRKFALDTNRNESAVRAKIGDLRREFHPQLVNQDQRARTLKHQPWTHKKGGER